MKWQNESHMNRLLETLQNGVYLNHTLPVDEMDAKAGDSAAVLLKYFMAERPSLFYLGNIMNIPVEHPPIEKIVLPFSPCIFEVALTYRDEDRNALAYHGGMEAKTSRHRAFIVADYIEGADGSAIDIHTLELKTNTLTANGRTVTFDSVDNWGEWGEIRKGQTGLETRFSHNLHPSQLEQHPNPSKLMDDVNGEGSNFVLAVVAALSLLSCKNVEVRNVYVPKELQNSRKQKGRLPFWTYKILALKNFAHDDKLPNGRTIGEQKHASPRLHWRRGHIRHHQSAGNIFVSPCVVGRGSLGVVEKDYRLVF